MATTTMNQLGRCIQSAAENFKLRAFPGNLTALEDLESDLKGALKAVEELINDELKARNSIFQG